MSKCKKLEILFFLKVRNFKIFYSKCLMSRQWYVQNKQRSCSCTQRMTAVWENSVTMGRAKAQAPRDTHHPSYSPSIPPGPQIGTPYSTNSCWINESGGARISTCMYLRFTSFLLFLILVSLNLGCQKPWSACKTCKVPQVVLMCNHGRAPRHQTDCLPKQAVTVRSAKCYEGASKSLEPGNLT